MSMDTAAPLAAYIHGMCSCVCLVAASLANRSLTTEPAVHLQRYDQPSVRNGAHHFNETGDAPHGFEEQVKLFLSYFAK